MSNKKHGSLHRSEEVTKTAKTQEAGKALGHQEAGKTAEKYGKQHGEEHKKTTSTQEETKHKESKW